MSSSRSDWSGPPVGRVFEVLRVGVVSLQKLPLRVEQGTHCSLRRIPGKGVHRDVCRRGARVPALAHGRGITGGRLAGATAGAPAEPVSVAGDATEGRLLDQLGAGLGAQFPVLFDEHVHGEHAHHLGHDEGQSAEIERPAVRVALLRVALSGVTRIGRYVHDDSDDVTQTSRDKEDSST